MPRPFSQQIIVADAPAARPSQAATEIVGSPVNASVSPAESEYTQLAQALGSVHEPLARLQAVHAEQDKLAAQQAGAAAAAKEANPGLVSDSPDPPPNAAVPPAYAPTYAQAYKKGLGQRLGQQQHDDYLADFSAQYQNEGFNKPAFDAQYRQRAFAGVTDPVLVAELGAGLDRAQGAADGEWTVLQQKRVAEQRNSMLSSSLATIDENTTASQAMALFQQVAADHKARGGTRAEAATALFDQMAGLSQKLGGRPDLFAVFDQPVPGLGGMKLSDVAGLGMKDKIFSEMHGAEEMQKRTLNEHNVFERGSDLDHINSLIADGSLAKMSDEDAMQYLKQYTGPTGALARPTAMAEVLQKRRAQIAVQQDAAYNLYVMNHGGGALLDPERAKKVIGQAFDQPMGDSGMSVKQALFASITNPQQAGNLFEPAVAAMVNAHSLSGVAFPDSTVKALIDSQVKNIPKDGADVSPQFQGMSRLYAKLEQTSKPLLYAYFDDTARQLFGSYNRATVEGQVSSPTAYKMAYASVDPDNIKAADEAAKDPAFRAQAKDTVTSAMRGLFAPGSGAWSPRFWPGAATLGLRPNTGPMEAAAQAEGVNYMKFRPGTSQDDVMSHLKQWTEANWFYEPKSNQYIQVPPAFNNSSTQEAISNYLDIVRSQKGNKDMNPQLVSKGNGAYDLFFYPRGIPEKVSDNVGLEQILALRNAQKNFSPAELQTLGTLRNKITDGTATADDLRGSESVVTKARAAGVWSDSIQQKADQLSVQAAQSASLTKLEPALATAGQRLQFNPASAIKPNGSLTAPIAQQFLQKGDLSGALTTMGEGVRTTAYKDSSGHSTIGIGYNLDSNPVADDFRKAGIPVEQIAAIKAGQRQLTVDQAMRLYQAVQPRYSAIAQKAVEERYPGEWPKLGNNVKAVLTDLAYQTGNVAQFKTGLDNLFKGDLSGSGLETKYRSRASGEYTVDERRHTLRTAMLSSSTLFTSLLSHAAKQPANAVQSRLTRAGTP